MRPAAVLLALLGCAAFAAPPAEDREKADGFVPLFNGKDLSGWKRVAAGFGGWSVEDRCIHLSKGGGMLYTEAEYDNFGHAAVKNGSGGMLHDDPEDRPPDVFGGTTTIHSGPDRPSFLLLPVIPPRR